MKKIMKTRCPKCNKKIDYYSNYKIRDKRRLKVYSDYGYKTLIIWESDLKNNIDYVVSQILEFHND